MTPMPSTAAASPDALTSAIMSRTTCKAMSAWIEAPVAESRTAARLGDGGIKLDGEASGLDGRDLSRAAGLRDLAAEPGQLRGLLAERGKLPGPDDREHPLPHPRDHQDDHG